MPSLSDLLVSLKMASAGYALIDFASDANVRFASTERICMHYVLAGGATLSVNGVSRELAPGDFACVVFGKPHEILCNAEGRIADSGLLRALSPADELNMVRFGEAGGKTALKLLSGSLPLSRIDRSVAQALISDFVWLRADQERTASITPCQAILAAFHRQGAGAFASALMQTLFVQAARASVRLRRGVGEKDLSYLHDDGVVAARRLIEREFHRSWTVASLAAAVGMSRSSLARHFLADVGTPPMEWLAVTRLNAAHRRLQQGTRVSDAAMAVGYRSVAAFSRAFHRYYGVAPVVVRETGEHIWEL